MIRFRQCSFICNDIRSASFVASAEILENLDIPVRNMVNRISQHHYLDVVMISRKYQVMVDIQAIARRWWKIPKLYISKRKGQQNVQHYSSNENNYIHNTPLFTGNAVKFTSIHKIRKTPKRKVHGILEHGTILHGGTGG